METLHKYDLAIIGAGASGLQFLYEYFQNPENFNKSVLLIDSGDRSRKSWCFWQKKEQTSFPFLVEKSWNNISYKSSSGELKIESVYPFQYHYISSEKFFAYFFNEFIPNHPSIHCVSGLATTLTEKSEWVEISCSDQSNYLAFQVADSRMNTEKLNMDKIAKQHFWGKFIEFEESILSAESATLMDFSCDSSNDQQAVFHYILPFSENYALIETTLFTTQTFNDEKYETIWLNYMQHNFPGKAYQIRSVEKGSIPMTIQNVKKSSKRIHYIGSNNGHIKASTGYAFTRMHSNAKNIIHSHTTQEKKARFHFYDSMLLSIIQNEIQQIPLVMDRLFKRIPFLQILKFLDEKSTIKQEIQIFSRLNIPLFIKHLLKLHK